MELSTLNKENSYYLTKKMFWRVFPVQVLMSSVGAVNAVIDGVIGSRFIGANAMTAVGLFNPFSFVIDFLLFMLSIGGIMVITHHLGKNRKEDATKAFSLVCFVLALVGLLLSASMLIFSKQLTAILKGDEMLRKYIMGYAILLISKMLSHILMDTQQLLGNSKLPMIAIFVMAAVNISCDILFICVFKLGIFGLGLATGVSYFMQFIVVLIPFFKKSCQLRFSFKKLPFSELPVVIRYGLPSALGQLTIGLKVWVENTMLLSVSGPLAIAAASVNSTLAWLIASIAIGACRTSIIMMSLFISEEDRTSMTNTLNVILRIGMTLAAVIAVAVFACASPLAALFYKNEPEALAITANMIRLFPSFILFAVPYYTFAGLYQAQGKKLLSFIFTGGENLVITVFIAGLGLLFGLNGIWLGLPVGALALFIATLLITWIKNKKITFKSEAFLLLPKGFGVPDSDRIDRTIYSVDHAIGLSRDICEFCLSHNFSARHSNAAGLSSEEICVILFKYSLKNIKNAQADVRIFVKDDKLTIRLRDNGTPIFSNGILSIDDPDDPSANIGIKLIMKMAEKVDVNSILGMNVITITV